ncbi:hypothetical protein KC685_04990 [Candidatus Dojkabacteria bacterium]|uniref:Uncharacterized protein n=1 Tax=Candidatus Dojkabacteria bacterium TaxID=2099670 RepID=A0A955I3L6_9BACT|nr:hypothetical protein [Candidatus Dojkabacteria bacterium]
MTQERLMPNFVHQFVAPVHYFGEEEAKFEWEEPEESAEVFLHTSSYENFKNDDCLFLFGRRGTGKTAIMRMLDYEINNDLYDQYNCSFILDQEEAYNELAIQLRGSPIGELPDTELVHFLKKKWKWLILVSAMIGTHKKYSNKNIENEKLNVIQKYLVEMRLLNEDNIGVDSIWSRVTDIIQQSLVKIEYSPIKLGLAISDVVKEINSTSYKQAETALENFLLKENFKCMVLIDSIEQYRLNDKISAAVLTALIETVRLLYGERLNRRVLCKAAFPSEIYPKLTVVNRGKVEAKNLFILWRYKDLVCLLAKRHYQKFSKGLDKAKLAELDDYKDSRKWLLGYLPEKIVTGQGIYFDTISYIIRHTQKKPRQVIQLFNIIQTFAEQEKVSVRTSEKGFINKCVHARLDILVAGALDIMEQAYESADKITRTVLNRVPCMFFGTDLYSYIKEVSAIRKRENYTSDDVADILLQAGVIGIECNRHKWIKKVELVEGLFEYQIKNTLRIDKDTKVVLHPMFYQELHAVIDTTKYVYPMPIEDEEKDVLLKEGIRLA